MSPQRYSEIRTAASGPPSGLCSPLRSASREGSVSPRCGGQYEVDRRLSTHQAGRVGTIFGSAKPEIKNHHLET